LVGAATLTYENFLEQRTLQIRLMHVMLLFLHSLCFNRWNYLHHRLELTIGSMGGKRLLKEISIRILQSFDPRVSSFSSEFIDIACEESIAQMLDEELVQEHTVDLNGVHYRRSYHITGSGVEFFEKQIRPILPRDLVALGERIRSKKEIFLNASRNSVLTHLAELLASRGVEVV